MNPAEEEDDRIEACAADWLARREEGLSPEEKQEFERWRGADERHAAAVARLEAACSLLEQLPLVAAQMRPVATDAAEPSVRRPRTSRWLRAGLAAGLAAALVLGALGWWQWGGATPAQVFSTSDDGYQRVVLGDGSVVELNASTSLRVELARQRRRVTLQAGEAHFSVAHDVTRPFIVEADGVAVRAVGTAFNVRRASAAVEVLVTEGRVQVAAVGRDLSAPARVSGTDDPAARAAVAELGANERLRIPVVPAQPATRAIAPAAVERIAPDVVRAALAWQERKLVFMETPLREVAAQFNRRNRTQLIIADESLATRPIGGKFAADNVEAFVRLLEESGSITVERRGETELWLHAR